MLTLRTPTGLLPALALPSRFADRDLASFLRFDAVLRETEEDLREERCLPVPSAQVALCASSSARRADRESQIATAATAKEAKNSMT